MSEAINYADLGLEDEDDLNAVDIPDLRKALKAKNKALKAKDEEISRLTGENTTLKGQVSGNELERLLKDKGAPPAIKKFMSDVEATDEAVTAWLAENGSLFGYDPTKGAEGDEPNGDATDQGVQLDPEMVAALAAMKKVQNQEANAAPNLNTGEDKQLEFLNKVGDNAQSYEEVEKALRDAGFLNLPAQ